MGKTRSWKNVTLRHRHRSCQPRNETRCEAERDPKSSTKFGIRSVRPHWSCRLLHGKARLLLKDIWRLNGQQWDDELPPVLVTKFLEWSKELPTLSDITIPRAYFVGEIEALELHLFGDSSQEVFTAVAFLRAKVTAKDSGSTRELAFVFRKARVAPMKALTNTKLELQA